MTALIIHPDGRVEAVADDNARSIAAELGNMTTRRASHVLPAQPIKRAAFRMLRALFSEQGKVAAWCRSWRGPWQVRFASDPHTVVFAHPSRRVCIAWEVEQLTERMLSNN